MDSLEIQQVVVKVPAKIMLAGEYSVLRGGRSLAATLDNFLTLKLTAKWKNGDSDRESTCLTLKSNLWKSDLNLKFRKTNQKLFCETEAACPNRDSLFARAATEEFERLSENISGRLESLSIEVGPSLSIVDGVGSSSALILALCLAMLTLENQKIPNLIDRWEAATRAYTLQKKEQKGVGSGYDIATQLTGGMVVFNGSTSDDLLFWPGTLITSRFQNLKLSQLVGIYTGGSGAPTLAQASSVSQYFTSNQLWDKVRESQEILIDRFIENLEISACQLVHGISPWISAVVEARRFFEPTNKFPTELFKKFQKLPRYDQTWTCKTSGAGGEDALLVFGVEKERKIAEQVLADSGWEQSSYKFGNLGASVTLI